MSADQGPQLQLLEGETCRQKSRVSTWKIFNRSDSRKDKSSVSLTFPCHCTRHTLMQPLVKHVVSRFHDFLQSCSPYQNLYLCRTWQLKNYFLVWKRVISILAWARSPVSDPYHLPGVRSLYSHYGQHSDSSYRFLWAELVVPLQKKKTLTPTCYVCLSKSSGLFFEKQKP